MKAPPSQHVGALLRRERLAAGYTVRDLALYIGISPKTYAPYEKMGRPPLQVAVLALSFVQARPLLVSRVRRLYLHDQGRKPTTHKKSPRRVRETTPGQRSKK